MHYKCSRKLAVGKVENRLFIIYNIVFVSQIRDDVTVLFLFKSAINLEFGIITFLST